MNLPEILITIVFIIFAIGFIFMFFQLLITTIYSETIIVNEECKNNQGQTIIGSRCSREVSCSDHFFSLKTCEGYKK